MCFDETANILMRLTCPNCDAQYEVPDEVVPTSGRDVQCSNCGKTWFQHHADHVPQEEADAPLSSNAPAPDEEVSPPPPPVPPTPRDPKQRQLDPAVADILRQEAEAEFEARRERQAQSLESQPDLGLDTADVSPTPARGDDDADRRSVEAKQRMARMRGEDEPTSEAAATAAAMSSRRELLPDIEEINSTLRNDTSPHGIDAEAREGIGAGGELKRKRGFRRGLITMLFVFVVFLLIYIYAPQISELVPALEPLLSSYSAAVDQFRIGLDSWVRSMLGTLDTMAIESEN